MKKKYQVWRHSAFLYCCSLGVIVLLCVSAQDLEGQIARCGIEGQVVDSSGAPLKGVEVTVDGSTDHGSQSTDDRGEFCFTRIEKGSRSLTLTKEGFATTALLELRVSSDERLQVRVVMDHPVYVLEGAPGEFAGVPPSLSGASRDEGGLTCTMRDPWALLSALVKSDCRRSGHLDSERTETLQPLNHGIALVNAGDLKGALAAFTKLIAGTHEIPEAFYYRGIVNCRLGRVEAAKHDFLSLLSVRPGSPHSTDALEALRGITSSSQ